MEMGAARYNPLDAQRFDPLRRTRIRLASLFNTDTSKLMMRQGLGVRTERASMGDMWPDHEVVVDPFEGEGSDLEGSCSSPPSTTDTCTTSPAPIDVYDHDDIVVTRTIIRPNPNPHRGPTRKPSRMQMVLTWMFSRLPSPTSTHSPCSSSSSSALHRSTPPSRSKSLVLQALNCFSTSSAFDSDEDDMEMHRMDRPVLLVIVKQTRERYEDDRAFKEIVGSVCPAAGVRGGV